VLNTSGDYQYGGGEPVTIRYHRLGGEFCSCVSFIQFSFAFVFSVHAHSTIRHLQTFPLFKFSFWPTHSPFHSNMHSLLTFCSYQLAQTSWVGGFRWYHWLCDAFIHFHSFYPFHLGAYRPYQVILPLHFLHLRFTISLFILFILFFDHSACDLILLSSLFSFICSVSAVTLFVLRLFVSSCLSHSHSHHSFQWLYHFIPINSMAFDDATMLPLISLFVIHIVLCVAFWVFAAFCDG